MKNRSKKIYGLQKEDNTYIYNINKHYNPRSTLMNNGKAKIQTSGNIFKIEVPSKKNWFYLTLGSAWMVGWYYGFSSAFRFSTFESDVRISPFILVWLLFWTLAGLFVVGTILWGFFGKESIEFIGSSVHFNKTIFGIGLKKKLIKKDVKNFRFNTINESLFGGNRRAVYGLGPGKVKFDYGMKTFSFGLSLDEAEANHLINLLNERIK